RLAEFSGQSRGFGDGARRDLFALWIAEHHVRAGIIGGVKPEVVRFRDAEGQMVVVAARAPDHNLVNVARTVSAHAGNLLFFRFFGGVRWLLLFRRLNGGWVESPGERIQLIGAGDRGKFGELVFKPRDFVLDLR